MRSGAAKTEAVMTEPVKIETVRRGGVKAENVTRNGNRQEEKVPPVRKDRLRRAEDRLIPAEYRQEKFLMRKTMQRR